MAKATQFHSGTDTFGRGVQVAQREDGKWFSRCQENRGRFGYCWTKWELETDLAWSTHYMPIGGTEYVERDEPKMEWGFSKLTKCKEKTGYRLPNS